MMKLLLAFMLAVYVQADTVCPDKKQQCDGEHTCCHLPLAVAGSEWGCCPFESGVCCADGSTCCPANHLCVPGKRACVPNEPIVKEIKLGSDLLPSMAVSERPMAPRNKLLGRSSGNVHRFEMPLVDADNQMDPEFGRSVDETNKLSANCSAVTETACSANTCCPLPDAICCANQRHCCPSATTCDLTVARCVTGSGPKAVHLPLYSQFSTQQATQVRQPSYQSSPSLPERVTDVVCPDQQSSCPDGTTCCELSTGGYGCCPLPNAVCCSDQEHCCPQNSKCDVTHGRCIQSDGSYMEFFKKFASLKTEKVEPKHVESVDCPDGSLCADGSTCCQLPSTGYGCCPIPNAVCCSDQEHCCPQDTQCDVTHGRCIQSDGSYTEIHKKMKGSRPY